MHNYQRPEESIQRNSKGPKYSNFLPLKMLLKSQQMQNFFLGQPVCDDCKNRKDSQFGLFHFRPAPDCGDKATIWRRRVKLFHLLDLLRFAIFIIIDYHYCKS